MFIRGCVPEINSAGYDCRRFPSEIRRSRWKYLFARIRMCDVRFTTWWNAINPRWLSRVASAQNGEMKRRARKTTGDVCSTMFIVSAAINGDWDLIVLDQLFSSFQYAWPDENHTFSATRSISVAPIEFTFNYLGNYHCGIINAIEIHSTLTRWALLKLVMSIIPVSYVHIRPVQNSKFTMQNLMQCYLRMLWAAILIKIRNLKETLRNSFYQWHFFAFPLV